MKMYPRAKVRDNCSSESDGGLWVIFKFLESLYFEEEKKQSTPPPSIPRNTNAYPEYIPVRSTTATRGISKSCGRKLGELPRSTTKNARVSSVPRPRAVLFSPENDGIFGSKNELNSNKSSAQRKKEAGEKVGSEAKVLVNQIKAGRPLNKAKCNSAPFHS